MTTRLLTDDTWKRLRALSRSSSRSVIAVPFFGSSGSELLSLKRGSRLIVNCTEATVRAGQVDPSELIKLVKKGVEVHTSENLHAKVYLFGRRAIIGSANISRHSKDVLIEAAIESTDSDVLRGCREFLKSLSGDRLGVEYLKKLKKLHRPPKWEGRGRTAGASPSKRRHAPILAAGLVPREFSREGMAARRAGKEQAKRKLRRPAQTKLDSIEWIGADLSRFRPGTRVLCIVSEGSRRSWVDPLGRVLLVRRFRSHGRQGGIVFLEVPRGRKSKPLSRVRALLGARAAVLSSRLNLRLLRNQELVGGLGRIL